MRLDGYLAELERAIQRLPDLAERWDSLPEDVREFRVEAIRALLLKRGEALRVAGEGARLLPVTDRLNAAATALLSVVASHPALGIAVEEVLPDDSSPSVRPAIEPA